MNRKTILEEVFRTNPTLVSEDDVIENVVVPVLIRLGYERGSLRRKVTVVGPSGTKLRKQADLFVMRGGRVGIVIEGKKLRHRLTEEDANQVLSYAHLTEPPPPLAILTNGRQWEVYKPLDVSAPIEDVEALPTPDELDALLRGTAAITIAPAQRRAAERLLVTLESKDRLEQGFRQCRTALAQGEGLLAESAFGELTKVLVCKFNEERREGEGTGTNRFTSAYIIGEGPLAALQDMFADAKRAFPVFQLTEQIAITKNQTVEALVSALEPFGIYGFRSPLGLAGAGGDVVGSVYEAFLTGTLRGELGQYLTPRQLVEFMVELADVQISERVLDLACGSAGFLVRAFLDLRKKILQLDLPPERKQEMVNDVVLNRLWGVEINPRLATLSRINLILHGDGFRHIYTGDSIADDTFTNTAGETVDFRGIEKGNLPQFEVILMNPPFNLPVADDGLRNRYEIGRRSPSAGSDYLMLERALRLLHPNKGRLLIIMPHGIASGAADQEMREFLREVAMIRGVISLPVGAFKPFGGSNARTCILFLSRKGAKPPVLRRFLAQADEIGYDTSSKYYKETERDDLIRISETFAEVRSQLQ